MTTPRPIDRHPARADARRRILITPEGIALPLTLASRSARIAALALDLAFIVLVMVGATVALALVAGRLDLMPDKRHGAVAQALNLLGIVWLAAMFLLRNAWFLFFELSPRGATPGKRITGIRIAARNGGRLTAEMVVARNLLRDVELFVPLALLGALGGDGDRAVATLAAAAWLLIFGGMPLWNRDRLRGGDLVAGSWVVEAPRGRLAPAISAPVPAAPAANYRFGEAELGIYGEHELQVLERVLRERHGEAMRAVATAICGRIGWNPPGEEETAPFLTAFYMQLRGRLEGGMRFGKRKRDKYAGGGHAGGG